MATAHAVADSEMLAVGTVARETLVRRREVRKGEMAIDETVVLETAARLEAEVLKDAMVVREGNVVRKVDRDTVREGRRLTVAGRSGEGRRLDRLEEARGSLDEVAGNPGVVASRDVRRPVVAVATVGRDSAVEDSVVRRRLLGEARRVDRLRLGPVSSVAVRHSLADSRGRAVRRSLVEASVARRRSLVAVHRSPVADHLLLVVRVRDAVRRLIVADVVRDLRTCRVVREALSLIVVAELVVRGRLSDRKQAVVRLSGAIDRNMADLKACVRKVTVLNVEHRNAVVQAANQRATVRT